MIAFDLDDTLYKEVDYVESGCRAVAKAVSDAGMIALDAAYQIVMTCDAPSRRFDRLISAIAENNRDDKAKHIDIKQILEIYRNHIPDIHLPEASRILLETLKNRSETLGLITDGRAFGQWAKIKALGLMEYFQKANILISAEIGFEKYSQEPFKMMMQRNPGETEFIYIGDNPKKDFYWANKLGWKTVMLIDDGRNIHNQQEILRGLEDSSEYRAQYSIHSLPEFFELL